MAQVVIIEMKRDSEFMQEARAILEENRFEEVREATFIGSRSANSVVRELKALDSYKKDRSRARIKLYYGSLSKA